MFVTKILTIIWAKEKKGAGFLSLFFYFFYTVNLNLWQ